MRFPGVLSNHVYCILIVYTVYVCLLVTWWYDTVFILFYSASNMTCCMDLTHVDVTMSYMEQVRQWHGTYLSIIVFLHVFRPLITNRFIFDLYCHFVSHQKDIKTWLRSELCACLTQRTFPGAPLVLHQIPTALPRWKALLTDVSWLSDSMNGALSLALPSMFSIPAHLDIMMNYI